MQFLYMHPEQIFQILINLERLKPYEFSTQQNRRTLIEIAHVLVVQDNLDNMKLYFHFGLSWWVHDG